QKYYLAWTKEGVVIAKLGLVSETLLQVSKAQQSPYPKSAKILPIYQRLTTSLRWPIVCSDREQWASLWTLISTFLYFKIDMLRKYNLDDSDNIFANYITSNFSGLELLYISRYPIALLSYPETILTGFVCRPDFNEVHALN